VYLLSDDGQPDCRKRFRGVERHIRTAKNTLR